MSNAFIVSVGCIASGLISASVDTSDGSYAICNCGSNAFILASLSCLKPSESGTIYPRSVKFVGNICFGGGVLTKNCDV